MKEARSVIRSTLRDFSIALHLIGQGLPQNEWDELVDRGADEFLSALTDAGLVIVPIEPTEAMWTAGRDPIIARDTSSNQWPLKKHLERAFEETPSWVGEHELELGHVTKGDCAVMVYRAMITASTGDGGVSEVPNPGTREAEQQGCTCPVLDNAHGKGYMGGMKDLETGETLFFISGGCPLHSTPTSEADDDG